MERIAFALILLPLVTWAGPGTGTFSDGGLRWYRDHSPAEIRHMHLSKNWGNDESPDLWAKSKGHCAAKVKIEMPRSVDAGVPSTLVYSIQEYLNWRSIQKWSYVHDLFRLYGDVMYYKLDRDGPHWMKTRTLQLEADPGPLEIWWIPREFDYHIDPNAFGSGESDGPNKDGSKSAKRWRLLKSLYEDAMDAEEYVHYAYWESPQLFDIDTFHSAKIGKTDKWNDDGVWRHKVRIKSCGGYWDETYYLDTVDWRTTDFDKAIHRGIDDKFDRHSACAGKGGWDATYLDRHSDGRILVTHRCNGKRSDGHFARGERKLSVTDSRALAILLSNSVDHY